MQHFLPDESKDACTHDGDFNSLESWISHKNLYGIILRRFIGGNKLLLALLRLYDTPIFIQSSYC